MLGSPAVRLPRAWQSGNGLEYINVKQTKKVIVVDINPEYPEIVKNRYLHKLPSLKILASIMNLVSDEDFHNGKKSE